MSGIEKFSCEQARELLDDFHDNELSSENRSCVETHLTNCEPCRVALADIESVSKLLKALPKEQLNKDFAEDLDSLLVDKEIAQKSKGAASKVVPIQRKFAFASAAAAVLLLAFAIHGTINHQSSQKNQPMVAEKIESPSNNVQKKVEDQQVEQKKIAKGTPQPKSEPLKDKVEQDMPKVASADESVQKIETAPDLANKKEVIAIAPARVVPKVNQAPEETAEQIEQIEQDQLLSTEAVVAFDNDEQDNLFYQMGIGTDEDGLYAIKL